MADQFRVIQCPVGELQAKLNDLADDFAPFVFAFSSDIPSSSVSVILMRPPRVMAQGPLLMTGSQGRH